MTQKWTFERLYETWNALVRGHRECDVPNIREIFSRERDSLIAKSGWTKLEFYTAIDEYHRDLNT